MIEQIQQATELFTAISSLLVALSSAIGTASVIAKYFPPPENPGLLASVYKWINAIAMNSGYAENKQ